jgi:hypothetical protein
MLPDVPIKPKLFKHKTDPQQSYMYSLSSVEIKEDHMINVDYNMGIEFDFVDRS